MLAVRILVTRPSLVVAAADPVLFGVWTGQPARPADITAALSVAVSHARTLKHCAIFVATHPDQPLPDAAVREIIQTEMRKLDPYLACGATVLTRDGFIGTAMRAVVSTLQLLSRPTHPEKIFGTPREAAAFIHGVLAPRMDSAPSTSDIMAAYDEATRKAWGKAAA